MAKGDKKRGFMTRTGKDESAYYAHSRRVCEKRYYNEKIDEVLSYFAFSELEFLALMECLVRPPQGVTEQEYVKWVIENIRCPIRLMREYLNHRNSGYELTKDYTIATYLRSFPKESFHRFSDRNHGTPSLYKWYCSENGTPLDLQAVDLSEVGGMEITEQDIVDFALAHPKGQHTYRKRTVPEAIAWAYYQLTGKKLSEKFAEFFISAIDNRKEEQEETVPF